MLAETRLLLRTGTVAAVRVMMACARVACLLLEHPTSLMVRAIVTHRVRGTWWQHSGDVARERLGVKGELWDMSPLTASFRDDPAARRKVVAE